MIKPSYTSAAYQDLASILRYIARDNATAALDWVDKIEAKCLLLAQNPQMGELRPELGEGVRSSTVGRYVIFHCESDSGARILRVIPGDMEITKL